MNFIDKIIEKARTSIKTIVLPEGEDVRVLKAAQLVTEHGFAKVIVLGSPEQIAKDCEENSINLEGVEVIDFEHSSKLDEYANCLFELRKAKGMTYEEAMELVSKNARYYASVMVKVGDADGFVSGACHPTADTLKPTLQIIKGREGVKTVSAFFIMDMPSDEFGEKGTFIFADCGMVENPNEDQLADIAIASAGSFKELVNPEGIPKVAMLSYSTKGSAHSELTDKVINATRIANEKAPEILIDGEMQLDAAIVDSVAKSKAPDSQVAGQANILIFPDLNAGNIGYKLAQRLGHAIAYGPLCQGLAKPVNDLSRGCTAEDIVGVVAITCVQAQSL